MPPRATPARALAARPQSIAFSAPFSQGEKERGIALACSDRCWGGLCSGGASYAGPEGGVEKEAPPI